MAPAGLRLLQGVAWVANRAEGLEAAMRGVLDLVGEHFSWPVGVVWMAPPGADDERLVDSGWWRLEHGRRGGWRAAARPGRRRDDGSLAGQVLSSGRAAWRRRGGGPSTDDPWERAGRDAGLGFAAAFPVTVGRRVAAVLEFRGSDASAPDDAALQSVAELGVPLGHVVERQALVRRLADLTLDEHRRLGRELHDTLGQQLTALGLMARTLVKRLAAVGSPEVERAELLAQTADEAKRQVRALIRNVAPVEVDADGLMAALAELAEATDGGFPPDCRFACEGQVPLEDNFVATQLYLIVQEAVHNAVKHAEARRIQIRLEGGGRADLRLSVEDDGRGLPGGDPARATGMGLRIMRHRAGMIGAEVEVGPPAAAPGRPPCGTRVTCRMPAGG